MSLKEQMETGKVYIEFGHASEEDKAYEIEIENQRQLAKDICFDYNNTRPTDVKRKDELLSQLLGSRGKSLWMEAPIHFAYGSRQAYPLIGTVQTFQRNQHFVLLTEVSTSAAGARLRTLYEYGRIDNMIGQIGFFQ